MRVGSIDPGVHAAAWSSFDALGKCFVDAGYEPVTTMWGLRKFLEAKHFDVLVIEQPKVYVHGQADPADLIRLANIVGACAASVERTQLVVPGSWKGQVPKPIHHRRIKRALGRSLPAVELTLKRVLAGKRHNVLDAIGLNLWFLNQGG